MALPDMPDPAPALSGQANGFSPVESVEATAGLDDGCPEEQPETGGLEIPDPDSWRSRRNLASLSGRK